VKITELGAGNASCIRPNDWASKCCVLGLRFWSTAGFPSSWTSTARAWAVRGLPVDMLLLEVRTGDHLGSFFLPVASGLSGEDVVAIASARLAHES
jgi:hypothetical protein